LEEGTEALNTITLWQQRRSACAEGKATPETCSRLDERCG